MKDTVNTQTIAESFAAVADDEDGFKQETASEIKEQLDSIFSELHPDADPKKLSVEQAIELHHAFIARNAIEDDIRDDS